MSHPVVDPLQPAVRSSALPMLDRLERLARGELPPPPIATLLGFTLAAVSPGQATIDFEVTTRHANPMGTLHGGVLCDIADAAMGMAYASTLATDETFTTLELKANFLKPVWQPQLQAIAKVVKRGRTVGLVECDVVDETQTLVARGTSTCMTLRGIQAEGRKVEGQQYAKESEMFIGSLCPSDDETSYAAGTFARYAREGVAVYAVKALGLTLEGPEVEPTLMIDISAYKALKVRALRTYKTQEDAQRLADLFELTPWAVEAFHQAYPPVLVGVQSVGLWSLSKSERR